MKPLRIAALVDRDLVPPETLKGHSDKEIAEWRMEFDVVSTLRGMGHEVEPVGIRDDLTPLRERLQLGATDLVFMMLEEFHGVGLYDHAIVSFLELLRQRYTGCNPRGLLLTRDKALSKKILAYHRIATPRFAVFPVGRKVNRPRRLRFPLFVKSGLDDASLSISQASIVGSDEALAERVMFVHEKTGSDAIAEEYIEGREFYVGVIGNERLQTFPVWEMVFNKMPEGVARIATARVKWNLAYQQRHGIETQLAEDLSEAQRAQIARLCKRVYRLLQMSGYGRIDLRMREDGQVYVIEANANPNLSFGEDFADSAASTGIEYPALLQRILDLGLRYQAPWERG